MIVYRSEKQLRQDVTLVVFASFCLLGAGLSVFGQTPATSDPANGKLASVIQLGEAIVKNTTTHSLSKTYVGNALNCTSCHLDNGRHPRAGTFLGTATAYPAWSPRNERVAIKQLSIKSDQASVQRGAALYVSRCAECHQKDGQGDKDNPPVWGERSYNDGAGLSSVFRLAAWLKVATPLDEADLTDDQAIDIAAYVNSQKRPHFELSQHLPVKERLGEYNASTAK